MLWNGKKIWSKVVSREWRQVKKECFVANCYCHWWLCHFRFGTLRAVVSPGRTLRFDGKELKPLRATVCFSIEHARPRDDYEYPTTRRQRELQQNNRFNKQNSNFARASRFYFCIFFAIYCTTTTWRCLILRFMDNVNKQRRNLFFFSLLNLDMVPWNSTPFGSPTFDKVSR